MPPQCGQGSVSMDHFYSCGVDWGMLTWIVGHKVDAFTCLAQQMGLLGLIGAGRNFIFVALEEGES